MLLTNKVVHAEDTFFYRVYMCQVSKLQHKYVIGLILLSILKDHKTHQTISCYTLLHQAARGEKKNSLRKCRDILVSDRDQQPYFIIIII